MLVGTGTEPVQLGDVQPDGKRRMPAADWAARAAAATATRCWARWPGPVTRAPAGTGTSARPARPGSTVRTVSGAQHRGRADPARRAACDVLCAVADRDAYANLLLPRCSWPSAA